ncbi:hypothetical protein B0H14DRAFT_2836150, partial [Mycena olivaceomarginata]
VSELAHLTTGVKVWLIGSAVCDIVITATMIFILNEYRNKTPWKKTDTLITKLIFNTVETGAVTTIIATVGVVLFILFPATNLDQLHGEIRWGRPGDMTDQEAPQMSDGKMLRV